MLTSTGTGSIAKKMITASREDDERFVSGENAAVFELFCRPIIPTNDWRDRDESGSRPNAQYHQGDQFKSALIGIFNRLGNGPVTVQGDGAQIQNTAGAAENVESEPQLTDGQSERPPTAHEKLGDVEGHDQRRHAHVRGGQRHQKVVLHLFQRAVIEDAEYDEGVAEDGHEHDH